jgi:hypothetical protein
MEVPQYLIEWLDENEYEIVNALVEHDMISEALEDEIAADEDLWDMQFDNDYYSLLYHKGDHALRISNQGFDYALDYYKITGPLLFPQNYMEFQYLNLDKTYTKLGSINSKFINFKVDLDIFVEEAFK